MGTQGDGTENDPIAATRDTYADYDGSGRDRLWDRRNPGFHRLKSDAEFALIRLVLESLPPRGGRVVDVGCGTADLAALISGAGLDAQWTGIDLLPDRIETARSRVPDGIFVVGSADAMPFPDHHFDIATAITMFSSVPDNRLEVAIAAEVLRVLRPGGWLVWYDLRYDNPSNPAVHGIGPRRLAELFPDWVREIRSITLVPPIARRLGPLTGVAYPVLHAIPPLRSHLIGRLRCPS